MAQWLFSEAGAGWLLGIVSLCGFVVTLARRRRPNRLVFAEIDRTSLIDINAKVRDRITVTYDQKPIARLGHVRAEIFNSGSATIHHAVISLTVAEPVRILEVATVSSAEGCCIASKIAEQKATITVDYVNPYRDHKQTLLVSLLVDGDLPKLEVSGGGAGWSLRQIPPSPTARSKAIAAFGFAALLGLWFLVINGVSVYLQERYGISPEEKSIRTLLINFTAALIVVASMLGFFYAFGSRRPKTGKQTLERYRNA
jgi:hypothetical protein